MPIATKYSKLIVRDSNGELVQMLPEVQTLDAVDASSNLPVSGAAVSIWGEAFVRNTGGNETIAGNKTFTGLTTFTGNLDMSGHKMLNVAGIEMSPAANDTGNGGCIDFHYNQDSGDYTSRIIESASGIVTINGVDLSNGNVAAASFTGSLSGNASTAAKLANARDINVSDADGTNTGTKISFDGSANGTIKLPATIKATLNGNADTATKAAQDASGNTITTTYATKSELPSDYAGATSSANGTHGLVPAATSAQRNYIFYGDGTWKNPNFAASVAVSASQIDPNLGNIFTKTISANTAFTIASIPSGSGAVFTLVLTNGGSKTITWPSTVKWADGVPPTLTSSGKDVLTFLTSDGGNTWYGTAAVIGAA